MSPFPAQSADETVHSDNSELRNQSFLRLGVAYRTREFKVRGVVLIRLPQGQKQAVCTPNDSRDVFLKKARKIAALPQALLIGALVLLVCEEKDAAPDAGDDRNTQVGRRLCKCPEPLRHAMGSGSFNLRLERLTYRSCITFLLRSGPIEMP